MSKKTIKIEPLKKGDKIYACPNVDCPSREPAEGIGPPALGSEKCPTCGEKTTFVGFCIADMDMDNPARIPVMHIPVGEEE